jgi:hypothetical protein
VIPKYASTKFANTSPASNITNKKVQLTRVKDEIKFIFRKKEKKKNIYSRTVQSPSESCARMEWSLGYHS